MNKHALDATMRRRQLVAKIHLQRAQLAAQLRPLGPALESVDAGARMVRRVRRITRHPAWPAAMSAVAAVLSLGAGLVMRRPGRLSMLMRAWRTLGPQLQALLRR